MSDLGGWVAKSIQEHWGKLLGGGGGITAVVASVRWTVARLKPDHHAYLSVKTELDKAADNVDRIVGRPATLEADCEKCRAASSHRRQAGLDIQEMFPGDKSKPFSPKISDVSLSLRALEDAVHSDPHIGAAAIRAVADETLTAIKELRRFFSATCDGRPSVRLFGRRGR